MLVPSLTFVKNCIADSVSYLELAWPLYLYIDFSLADVCLSIFSSSSCVHTILDRVCVSLMYIFFYMVKME